MNVVVRFTRAMEAVEWRGLVYTVFILNFVFACQLLLLQPLVSALGLYFDLSFVFCTMLLKFRSSSLFLRFLFAS